VGEVLVHSMKDMSHLRRLSMNIAKPYICFRKPLALLVVLFSLEQNQFAL